MAAEEEEVKMEVQAVSAVYGDDCIVLSPFPPHLRLHIKPRTADVHFQQFVEAIIEIQASAQYPSDPPYICVIGSKGLDDKRLRQLSAGLHDKACELASSLMLVALCEEAVETLSSMNHPEGDCPLCLHPLVSEDQQNDSLPFMKLMSCFHCFHSECIIRWWKWLQAESKCNGKTSSSSVISSSTGVYETVGDNMGTCPVCRKAFHSEDIEHVLNLFGSHSTELDLDEAVQTDDKNLLQCELETTRRQKFETISELQKQHGGLIEPRNDGVLFSSMNLPELVRDSTSVEDAETTDQQQRMGSVSEETGPSRSSRRPLDTNTQTVRREPSSSSNRSRPRYLRYSGSRNRGRGNSRMQAREWIKKEGDC